MSQCSRLLAKKFKTFAISFNFSKNNFLQFLVLLAWIFFFELETAVVVYIKRNQFNGTLDNRFDTMLTNHDKYNDSWAFAQTEVNRFFHILCLNLKKKLKFEEIRKEIKIWRNLQIFDEILCSSNFEFLRNF